MNIKAMTAALDTLRDAAPYLPGDADAHIAPDGRLSIHAAKSAQPILRYFGGSWVKSIYSNTVMYDQKNGNIRVTELAPLAIPEEVVFTEN